MRKFIIGVIIGFVGGVVGVFVGVLNVVMKSDPLTKAFKDVVTDVTKAGVERLVYGHPDARRERVRPGPHITYDRQGKDRMTDYQSRMVRRETITSDNGLQFVLITREDADKVIETIAEMIEIQSFAKVADVHELLALPTTHADHGWGWTSTDGMLVESHREGYLLKLPSPEPV